MENASKALIMAAEILFGIILISVAVLGYSSWRGFSENIHTNIENRNIQQFNNKFLQYNGRTDLTAHDIISVIKLADEYNHDKETGEYIQDTNYQIQVILNANVGTTATNVLNDISKFIMDNMNNKFSANVIISEKTQIVKQIVIKKVP